MENKEPKKSEYDDERLRRVIKEARERLLADPKVRRRLMGGYNPIEERHVQWLIDNAPNLFATWDWISKNPEGKTKEKIKRLSKKMRDLSDDLESSNYSLSIFDSHILGFTYNLVPETRDQVPSLAEYLRRCASHLEDWGIDPIDEEEYSFLSRKKNGSQGQRAFFIRRVYRMVTEIYELSRLKKNARNRMNIETAEIVSILLNEEIKSDLVYQIINPALPKKQKDEDSSL